MPPPNSVGEQVSVTVVSGPRRGDQVARTRAMLEDIHAS
jgi:hypothetical protein